MKRLMAAVLLLAFGGAPSLARAATINTAPVASAAVAETPSEPPSGSTPASATAPGETSDYAAREAAAPELGKFQGGSVVVFIGGGTLLIVVLIVLIVLVL